MFIRRVQRVHCKILALTSTDILGNNLLCFSTLATSTTTTTTTTPAPTVAPNCNGIPMTDWSCCTTNNPCNINEGDCDDDRQCAAGLVCGTNNCRATGITGSNWHSGADCCVGMTHFKMITFFQQLSYYVLFT